MPPPPTPSRRSNRTLLALLAVAILALAALVVGLVAAQRPAHATGRPGGGHATATPDTGYASAGVIPGAACDTPGVTARHGTEQYRCWQKPGEDCPHWHWVYNPDVPKSTRTAWPAGPCPTCSSPTPSPTMTTPPATTPAAATPPPSSPAALPHPGDSTPTTAVDVPVTTHPPAPPTGGTLPVTGAPALPAALTGLVLALAGLALRFWPRRC